MKNRILTLVIASFSFAGVTAAVPTHAQECAYGRPMADLGFTYGYAVRATSMAPGQGSGGSAAPSMREEPRVLNIDPNGPAASKLTDGDRISRVNGLPVTTPEGTSALRNARVGHSLVLTIRRGDKLVPVTVAPVRSICPTRAAAVAQGAPVRPTPSTIEAPASVVTGVTIDRVPFTTAAASEAVVGPLPGWLGLGFDCSECSLRSTPGGRAWYFSEPPVIYNVDTNSPAYTAGLRRGDVLLSVDGKDVRTQAAGARLGQAKAGETLRLSYRRAGRTQETTLRVGRNPAVARELTVDARTDQLLRSAQELRASTNESSVREMMNQLQRSRAVEEANLRELEKAVRAQQTSPGYKLMQANVDKVRATVEARYRSQERMLTEMLREEKANAQMLTVVEQQIAQTASAPVVARVGTLMPDSAVTYARSATRDQRLRYSGSVGTANVEVRGPGSVSVQGDGDDLIIITSDAVIRITGRKLREQR